MSIFLSYRRDDTPGEARSIYDRMSKRFGADTVFLDVEHRGRGDFLAKVRAAIEQSSTVVVILGPGWLSEQTDGSRRIDDPDDPVHVEVATALRRMETNGLTVVPVFVRGARMPTKQELPADLRPLRTQEGVEISDTRFDFDMDRLLLLIEAPVVSLTNVLPGSWSVRFAKRIKHPKYIDSDRNPAHISIAMEAGSDGHGVFRAKAAKGSFSTWSADGAWEVRGEDALSLRGVSHPEEYRGVWQPEGSQETVYISEEDWWLEMKFGEVTYSSLTGSTLEGGDVTWQRTN